MTATDSVVRTPRRIAAALALPDDEPAPLARRDRPAPLPEDGFWVLRRLRRVVRRRLRVELASLQASPTTASDGGRQVVVTQVSTRDPRVLAWRADDDIATVVYHDGCGAREIGGGGLHGLITLPTVPSPGAYLAFCYDIDRAAAPAPRLTAISAA